MVGWRGKRNGSGDRGGSTNDNLFQYINIMRGSRNFSQEFSRIGESKSPSQHLPLINPCKNIFKSLCMKPSPHYSQLTPWSNSSSQCILNDSKCWQLCNVSATSALDVMAHCFRGLIGDWIWHLFPTWDFWFN